MRLLNYIALSLCALMGFTSCEMREEILDKSKHSLETGILELGIQAKDPVVTKASVSTDNFPVLITGKEGSAVDTVIRSFDAVSELPSFIILPVGEYTVSSHTAGELTKSMDVPFYAGETVLTIQSKANTKETVDCKMRNSKIQLSYSAEFLAAFKSWTITLDDGSDTAMPFRETDKNPAPVYWYFGENASALTVNIKAVTIDGNTVSGSQVYTKKAATESYPDESEYFTGGDALVISFEPVDPEDPTEGIITGFDVRVDISFSDHAESVTIPVEKKDDPTPNPDDPASMLTCDAFKTGIEYSIAGEDWPSATDVIVSTPSGLKSLKVTIEAGNEGFNSVVGTMFANRELVGDTELEDLLGSIGVTLPMPQANATNYSFPVGTFYAMMNIYGPTVDADEIEYEPDGKEAHVFRITVEDNAGKTETAELSVTIRN